METEFLQQEYRAPQSLFDLLPRIEKPKRLARNQGPRQQLISKTAYELGIEKHYLSGLYFQTKDFTDDEIISLKEKALTWKTGNPAAWFRSMVKQKRAEIKLKLNETNPT